MAVAIIALVRGARRGDAPMRRTRYCLAGALLVDAVGTLVGLGYVAVQGSIPVPSFGDVLLLWAPLTVLGLWLVPTAEGRAAGTMRFVADGAVAASALFSISWLLAIEPLWHAGRWSPAGRSVTVLYPLCDVFVAAVALAVRGRARSDVRELLNYITAGLLLIALSDTGYCVQVAERGVATFGWPDAALQAGFVLIIFALVRRPRGAPERRSYAAMDRNILYIPVAVAVGVAVWHVAAGHPLVLSEVIAGAVMVAAMLFRQFVYTREISDAADRNRYDAAHDALTGLANRKAFFARLDEHLYTPDAGTAAVLLFDLDGFKAINDTFGHDVGDSVLVSFASSLREEAPSETVARLGGDEFAVLVTGPDVELRAVTLGNALARGCQLATGGRGPLAVACSIGIALSRDGDASEALLRRADLAMYTAKRSPMSRLACFSEEMADVADRSHLLAAALVGAAERGELSLLYQPLYQLCDRSFAGAEALLQWTHPSFGQVPPAEFLPIAQDTGCIDGLDAWVLERALSQLATWRSSGRELPWLFVSVSASRCTAALPETVRAALGRHGVDPEQLVLQIAQGQVPALATSRPLRRLRDLGVRLAVDDFGAGSASLAQLAGLQVDILKIDREVIANLGQAGGRPVLDAVIGLAAAPSGLPTVAEGSSTGPGMTRRAPPTSLRGSSSARRCRPRPLRTGSTGRAPYPGSALLPILRRSANPGSAC